MADAPPLRSRRTFLDWLLGGSLTAVLGSIVYPALSFLNTPKRQETAAGQVEAGPVNDEPYRTKGFKIIEYGGEAVIVVRVSDEEFRAFSAVCTHLQCIVEYRKAQDVIWCNCHDGRFNLQGEVVGGPPPRPLQQFSARVAREGDGTPRVVVTRI